MAETPLPSLLGALKAAGRFAWDVLIPRFITEVDAFQWLGIGFGYRMGNFRKWGSDPWGDA